MKRLLYLLPIIALTTIISCNIEPIDPGIVAQNNNNLDCQEAIQASEEASANFANATEENYDDLCIAFATAIQVQIETCGDATGTLQAAIDTLNCTTDSNACSNAATISQEAELALQSASDEDYAPLCNAYAAALQSQINACGDPDGELQAIIEDLGDCGNESNEVLFLHKMSFL